MADILQFPDKKKASAESEIEPILTEEIIHEYTSTMMLIDVYKDDLTMEDWQRAYQMMKNFNYLLMKHIDEMGELLE